MTFDKNTALIQAAQAILTDYLTDDLEDAKALDRIHRLFDKEHPTENSTAAIVREGQGILQDRHSRAISDPDTLTRLVQLLDGPRTRAVLPQDVY